MLNPSRVDNMPNSVLEAMASGVPVVSTAVGGVPFIVRDGVTGLLVAPGDAAAMARPRCESLPTPTSPSGWRRERLNDVQQYAWSSVRERWLAVYRAVLADAPAAVRQHDGRSALIRAAMPHPVLSRRVVYPLQERLMQRPTFAYLERLERSQWLTRAEIERLQMAKLKVLLRTAAQRSPGMPSASGRRGSMLRRAPRSSPSTICAGSRR